MREPKTRWVVALRALTGNERDDIRWNEALGRWEFLLAQADGVVRSEFWCWFDQPIDPVSGLHPPRDLDDDAMLEALRNLETTFVGNAFDGAGTTQAEVLKRMKQNREEGQRRWRQGGVDFADMTLTTAGRGHRLRGAVVSGSMGTPAQRSRKKADELFQIGRRQ